MALALAQVPITLVYFVLAAESSLVKRSDIPYTFSRLDTILAKVNRTCERYASQTDKRYRFSHIPVFTKFGVVMGIKSIVCSQDGLIIW